MKLPVHARALGKQITLITTAFILAVSTLTAAVPFILSQRAGAVGAITISTVAELREAIVNQEDGQVWTVQPGTYGLAPFNDITVEGQTGWYFPITADNLTINGVGNPTLFGTGFTTNGNWPTQNFVSVFGDNVTIDGVTLMPKVQPNKTVEVLGSDFTLRNSTIAPNTLVDPSEYASISDDNKQWGGSIYFSHAGNHTLQNVTIKNAGVSFRYSPSGTNIAFTNVNIENTSSFDWINTYRFSTGFNNAGNSITGAPAVTYHVNSTLGNLTSVLNAVKDGDTIEIDSDLTVTTQSTVKKAVTINGNGHTITGNFVKTDNGNNSVVSIQSDNVTVSNLTVDAVTGANQLHGINVFESEGVTLNTITAKNGRSGVAVNGSVVTIDGITTSGNIWHGVNIDKPGAHLTIKGATAHTEALQLFVDNRTVGQVTDVDNRYDITAVGLGDIYTLDVTAPNVPTHVSPSADALINTNNFWFDWSDETATGAVRYEIQNSTDPATDGNGSFQNVMWTGDYNHIQPTDSRAQSVGANGTWYWQVRSVDAAGNASAWTAPWKVTIDADKPTTPTLSTPVNNQVFTTNSIPASWSAATDANGINKYQVEYIYDDGHTFAGGPYREVDGATLTRTHAPSTAEQGGVTIRVRAFDNAGNASEWSNAVHYFYDNTKPTVAIDSASLDNVTKKLNVSVTGTDAQSGVARIGYNLYNASNTTKIRDLKTVDYTDYSSPKTSVLTDFDTSTLPTGTYVIRAAARDNAGLLSSYATQTIYVDNTVPTATFIFPTAGPSAKGFKVVFSESVRQGDAENAANYFLNNWPGAGGSGDLAGDADVSYDNASRTATITFTNADWYISPEQQWGARNIHDLAGNSITESTDYSTDLVAPVLSGLPATASPSSSLTTTWTWDAATDPTDPTTASGVKGYEYAFVEASEPVTPSTWTGYTDQTSAIVTAPEDGTYKFYLRAVDNAGNVGIAQFGQVVIETETDEEEEETTPPAGSGTDGGTPTVLGATDVDEEEGDDTQTPTITGPTGFASILGTNTNNQDDTDDTNGSAEVEGLETANTLAAAVDADNTDGNALGLAWYWWLLILAGGATGLWWLIAALRGRGAE